MSWTMCTSGSPIARAGANANVDFAGSGTYAAEWSDEAEDMCCVESRVDLIANYSTLTSAGKKILQMITSSYIAQQFINYEPEAIGTTGATLRLNILENNIRRGLKQISDQKVKTYLGAI